MKAFGNIAKDSQVRAVASGTLPSGKPIVINSDGTVSSVVETTDSAGSSSASVTTYSLDIQSAYDSSNNRVVIVFRGANNNPTAAVGTVSGTSVSFGTPVVIDSSVVNSDSSICFDSSNNKVVVTFGHDGSKGVAYVGTVSGTSISFGSEVVFENAATVYTSATFDSTNNKVVIFYRDSGNSNYGTAIVGTVSGTSISFGTAVVFNSANTPFLHSSFDSNAGKVVAVYKDVGNSNYGTAIVGTVSGTSISFGSEATFATTNISYPDITFDSTANKHVIVYQSPSSTTYGNAIVGTVSGTSISFGSAVVFESAAATYLRAIYDPSVNKTLVLFRDEGNSNKGTAIVGTVSGTSISFGSPFICFDFNATSLSGVYDSSTEQVVASCANGDSSENVHSSVISVGGTNLTSENYIGMSRGSVFNTGSDTSVGSETEFINQMGNEISNGVFDPDSNKVILAYSDQDNSVRGTAIVGTVSGTSISFGTPTVYNSAETTHIGITYDTANDKVVIVYRDGTSNNNYGNAIVGTVSGTDISFGTAVVYNSALSQYNAAAFDANAGKILIAYKDADASIQSRVATVSGTSISFGTEVEVDGGGNYINTVYDSNSNKVVVIFTDSSNSNRGSARVGTISGTDVSYGTLAVMVTSITEDIHSAFDSTNNKIVVGYKDGGDGDKGKAFVGTVSGTDISFGSGVVVHNASTNGFDGVVYNSNLDKVFFFYRDSSTLSKFVSGTVSGTAVGSVSSETTYHNASTNVPFQVYDGSSTNIVAAYRDAGDSNKGKAVVVKPDDRATTRGEVADGGKAVIDSTNTISRNQIGLTAGQTLYVQTDGTLSETADDPSVTAGTAISATELIVKG